MSSAQDIFRASNRVSSIHDVSIWLKFCANALDERDYVTGDLTGDDVILIAHSLAAFSDNLHYLGEEMILSAQRSVISEDDDDDETLSDDGYYPYYGPFPSSLLPS